MNNIRYGAVLNFAIESPWAILPAKLAVIMDLLAFRADGGSLTAEEIQAQIGVIAKPEQRQAGAIAVLPLWGTIIPRGNMLLESSGATSAERFGATFRAAMTDPAIGGILIDIDSPGGNVQGVPELADEIYRSRGSKPILAVANNLAASAAYWIGTAADEMMVTPSGEVGSIGVLAMHEDLTAMQERKGVKTSIISAGKYKMEGSPFGPLDDEARAAIQERVDDYYQMFVSAVARNRGVVVSEVRSGFGEGRVVGAKQAKSLGMVDGIGTVDDALARLGRMMKRPPNGKKANGELSVLMADVGISETRRRLRLASGRVLTT